MSAPRKIWISSGRGNLGVIKKSEQTSWAKYVEWQREEYATLPIAKTAYAALKPDEKAELKKKLAFSLGAKYRSTIRKAVEIELRDTINIDVDKQEPQVYEAVREAARSVGRFLHVGSSSNEVNGKRSGRFIFPLSRSVEPHKEFAAVSRKIAEKLGIERIDPVSHRLNQICYVPSRCSDAAEVFEDHNGPWLDVDAVLAGYSNWQDPDEWPRSAKEQSVHSEVSQLGDPRDKKGLIGAFCRKYDFVTAIETFDLPYLPTGDEWRWTPLEATSSGGARLYPPPGDSTYAAWMWNDHDHGLSPKRNINAYDAVREHKFPGLDKADSERGMNAWIREAEPDVAEDVRRDEIKSEGEFNNLDEGPDAENADASAPAATPADQPKKEQPSRFRPTPIGDFANGPDPEWTVEEVIPEKGIVAFYGDSSVGKSFTALDMGLSIARGIKWHGRDVKRGKVVYLAGESPGGFRMRVRAYAKHHGICLPDLDDWFLLIDNMPDLRKKSDVSEVLNVLRPLGPLSLVVIDTLARATPGADENGGKDMGPALGHCQTIGKATGAAVALIHHCGKDQARGMRGWSGIRAFIDTEIEVTARVDMHRVATVSKQRDGEDGLQFGYELVLVPYGRNAKGKEVASRVVKPEHVTAARPKATPLLTLPQVVTWKILQSGGALSVAELQTQGASQLPRRDPQKKDRRRDLIFKAIEQLAAKGLVEIGKNDAVRIVGVATAEQFDNLEEEDAAPAELAKPVVSPPNFKKKRASHLRVVRHAPHIAPPEPSKPDIPVEATVETPVAVAEVKAEAEWDDTAQRDALMKQLDIDAGVADILVREGLTAAEIANGSASKLNDIEEFDSEIVEQLRTRAQAFCAGMPA